MVVLMFRIGVDFMKLVMTERTYVDDDYCFSINESRLVFSISMCSIFEYEDKSDPEFYPLGLYAKADGWTLEKVEALIEDKAFLYESASKYSAFLSDVRRGKKKTQWERDEEINTRLSEISDDVSDLTDELHTSASPLWTFKEASEYSQIGINRLRELAKSKKCYWTIKISNGKTLVRVEDFKRWLDEMHKL